MMWLKLSVYTEMHPKEWQWNGKHILSGSVLFAQICLSGDLGWIIIVKKIMALSVGQKHHCASEIDTCTLKHVLHYMYIDWNQ